MDADANSALRQAANALSAVMAKQRPYSVVAAEDSVILFLRPEHFACLYHTELMPKLRYECTNAWRLRAGVPDVVCGSPRCCRTASLLATRLPTMPLWQPKKYAGLKQKSSVTYERSLLATATTAKSVHLLSSRQPPPPHSRWCRGRSFNVARATRPRLHRRGRCWMCHARKTLCSTSRLFRVARIAMTRT